MTRIYRPGLKSQDKLCKKIRNPVHKIQIRTIRYFLCNAIQPIENTSSDFDTQMPLYIRPAANSTAANITFKPLAENLPLCTDFFARKSQ